MGIMYIPIIIISDKACSGPALFLGLRSTYSFESLRLTIHLSPAFVT